MSILEEEIRRVITVPEYYSKYIDSSVSLMSSPKQCCPFHKENTPSFIYDQTKGKWRCYGACKTGGDVIALHQKKKKLKSRDEAIIDMCSMLGLNVNDKLDIQAILNHKPSIDLEKIELQNLLTKLDNLKDIDIYCKTDVIMAYALPVSETIKELKKLYDSA